MLFRSHCVPSLEIPLLKMKSLVLKVAPRPHGRGAQQLDLDVLWAWQMFIELIVITDRLQVAYSSDIYKHSLRLVAVKFVKFSSGKR